MAKRGSFGSRFGTVAAVGGSVIGLGNIWRFPYVAGENGGAAFILIYLATSFLISIPIMLSEFSIGRSTRRNPMRAFNKLAPGSKWKLVGYMGILTAFVILSFYCVIAGWAFEFLKESVFNQFNGRSADQIRDSFNGFVASGWKPVIWTFLFTVASAGIVLSGVEKGIERYTKILMPMLFVLLLGMAVNSLTLDGAQAGIEFLLKPDFSKITGTTVLQALGQSFFSMSLGMGAMITYGSYLRKNENMPRVGAMVAFSDITVAILSGLAIFPAVFSFGISPTSGPGAGFPDAAERLRPDDRRLYHLRRLLFPVVRRSHHLVDFAVGSHRAIHDRRVAPQPQAGYFLHRIGHHGHRIAVRAVDDARFETLGRRHESFRSMRPTVVERADAAGRPADRPVHRLGIFPRKIQERIYQQPAIRRKDFSADPFPR